MEFISVKFQNGRYSVQTATLLLTDFTILTRIFSKLWRCGRQPAILSKTELTRELS